MSISLHCLCVDITCSQVSFLRKSHGSRLNVFAPVNDLSALSMTGSSGRSLVPGRRNDVAIAGGQILGDEYSDHVVKVCGHLLDYYSHSNPTSTRTVVESSYEKGLFGSTDTNSLRD